MAATRIIPGVQITVVKEVVPPQLAPSGVLGLVGLTEKPLAQVERAASWSRFIEVCGPGTAYSMPEARQALANGVFELAIAAVSPTVAECAKVAIPSADGSSAGLHLEARAPGPWANNYIVKVTARADNFDLEIRPSAGASPLEIHRRLTSAGVADTLQKTSTVVQVKFFPKSGDYTLEGGGTDEPSGEAKRAHVVIPSADGSSAGLHLAARVPGSLANGYIVKVTAQDDKFNLEIRPSAGADPLEVHRNLTSAGVIDTLQKVSTVVQVKFSPKSGDYTLAGGTDASVTDYTDALKRLEDEPDVDLVLAAVQDFSKVDDVINIYSQVISHCRRMSEDSKGRIGFGQAPPDNAPAQDYVDMASTLFSDRFVLVAPHGVVGAVAGRVGNLTYFQSPTFKQVGGLATLSCALTIEEQQSLLKGNVVPIINQRGRGIIILRGLTTDGDQISVRRVADRAVRGVKMLGELFIGRLNNEDGRGALKQKLTEFLVQMEKDGAIVPSTDGSDPAFKVDVYSSQADFAQGIVRVDMAVRPVRAIDFIYATILVQV